MVVVSNFKVSFGGVCPTPKMIPRSKPPRVVEVCSRAVFHSSRWNYNLYYHNNTNTTNTNTNTITNTIGLRHDDHDQESNLVHCEVEVLSWRERRIRAHTLVLSDVDSLWTALTDYERLSDFVPNLLSSRRIPSPYPGRIWLEQIGFQRALYWHIEARVVLDLQPFINSEFDRELHFSMVDGDFKKFQGKWFVKCGTRSSTSILSYEVSVIPNFNFPAIFLERIIRSDLPVNLRALAYRAERCCQGNHNIVAPAKHSVALVGTDHGKDNLSLSHFKEGSQVTNFGRLVESNSRLGSLGKSCTLDRQCMVDEVHLRRFDGLLENGGVHRFVVASITVKAPVREVWSVLTAYERLPEIVPNMAISKILSRENNKVRILQEGCKGLLYMVLHARVVLDLCELHEQEISFEQVEGDFYSLQGKWVLEQLGNQHTLLKYTVESKMHKDIFLSEAIMEEVIYEDLPSNLCAIRDYIEKRDEVDERQRICMEDKFRSSDTDSDGESCESTSESMSSRQRPRVPGLQRDIEILKEEILKFISEHGEEGFMPMRKQLRLQARVDIEKAITRMGGFRRIASLMNLSLAYKNRKPKGYWDNLENLEEEISRFQLNWGMDPSYMPSRKAFERAGRYDIARALEKWGGLHEVSRLLSLKLRHPNRHTGEKKTNANSNSYVAHNTNSHDHLDIHINWVQ